MPLCLLAQRRSRDTYQPAPDEQRQTSDYDYGNSNYENNDRSNNRAKNKDKDRRIFTGFTGGMMIHGGYSFAKNPDELFRNGSLTAADIPNLPRDGFTMGLGGALRLHLIDHIHLGGEGHMSYMPLTSSGTSIRTGWGGVMCDFYATLGIVRPIIGLTVGGGSTRRLFVPSDKNATVTGDNKMEYNASFTKTPYFLLDPYIGLEIQLGKVALLIRADYLLPFGKSETGFFNQNVSWSNFISPSGPRLYIGCMFGNFKRNG